MTGQLQPDAIPYGVYYCRSCAGLQPCEVAVGSNSLDPECPIECATCHQRIGEETDVRERWPMPPEVTVRQTLTADERAAGRRLARSMALGAWEGEYSRAVPAPVAAPPPGYRARAVADIETLRGRR